MEKRSRIITDNTNGNFSGMLLPQKHGYALPNQVSYKNGNFSSMILPQKHGYASPNEESYEKVKLNP